ncbi:MAG TPA: electron transfer flavoprotein subunit alpha, partial [Dehalococcoidales bacterium]
MANSGVMVLCEVAEGKLASISLELLGAGARLAEDLGQPLDAVLVGSAMSGLAQEAITYGAAKVFVVDDPFLKDYLTDSYLNVIERVIKQANPAIVLSGQTASGRDLTPRLAFRLSTAAVLDC